MKKRTEINDTSFNVLPPLAPSAAPAPPDQPSPPRLQWPAGVEMARRQIDAVSLQLFQEIRPNAGGAESAVDVAGLVGMLLDEAIYVLRLDLFVFHASNFTDARDPPFAIG